MSAYILDNDDLRVVLAEDGSRLTVASRHSGWRYDATDYAVFTYGGTYFFNLREHADIHVTQEADALHIMFDHVNYWARFPENGFCKPKDGPDLRFHFSIRLEDDEVTFAIEAVEGLDDEELEVSFPYRPLRWFQQDKAFFVMGSVGFGTLVPFPSQPRFSFRKRTENLPLYGIYGDNGGMGVRYDDIYDQWTSYAFGDSACNVNTSYSFIRRLAEYKRTLHLTFLRPGENYVAVAKYYRRHLEKQGRLFKLADKIAKDPEVGKLPGSVIWKHNVYWQKELPQGVRRDYSLYVTTKEAGDDEGQPNNWTAREVFDTAHQKGFDRVCILNTGWNRYGFDSGYPTRFPVNPERGTAEEFRASAEYGRTFSPDYILSVHDNYRDTYPLSPEFSKDEMFHTIDGAPLRGGIWHGGRCYLMCSQNGVKYAKRDLPEIAKLSGRGCIYVDVLGCVHFQPCFHPNHPGSGRDDALGRLEILKEAKRCFGAVATESAPSDYCLEHVDVGAYVVIDKWHSLANARPIPLWQLIYHDCVMNFCAPGHSGTIGTAFRNYMALYGLLPCGFDDDSLTVSRKMRATYLAEMLSHEFLENSRQRTTFSDGTVVTADFFFEDGKGHFSIHR